MVLFLAGGSGYTRRQGLRRLKERLENVLGASNIRYEPSAIKPTTVVVDVDSEMFLEEPFPRDTGRIGHDSFTRARQIERDMIIISDVPRPEELNEPVAMEYGAVRVNYLSIVSEVYENEFGDEPELNEKLMEFYMDKVGSEKHVFVHKLLNDWIPWIELQGERATGEHPDNDYIIHSVQTVNEVKSIISETDSETFVISQKGSKQEILDISDIIIDFSGDNHPEELYKSAVRTLLTNEQ